MMAPSLQLPRTVEWGVAARPLPGQSVSGDLHVVTGHAGGTLIGVIDGLGHGDEATAAARIAAAVMEQHAAESVTAIVQHCHRALLRSRGVVMTLASIHVADATVSTLGVGNVETVLFRGNSPAARSRESVLLRGGVVGYQLPALQAGTAPIMAGDVMVFATDGVREDFAELVNVTDPPAQLAEHILARKFRGTDDGLVLVCRYLGPA